MSHFSRIKTKFTNEDYLMQALRDLRYEPRRGKLAARGYQGSRTKVDILIRSKDSDHDVGFVKKGDQYVCVADWFGVHDIQPEEFLQNLNQRYASLIVKDELTKQGFSLAEERTIEGHIHMVLRRST